MSFPTLKNMILNDLGQIKMVVLIFTDNCGHLGDGPCSFHSFLTVRFWYICFLSFTIMSSRIENRWGTFCHNILGVLPFWRPSWAPSWIMENVPAGITGSFSMLFVMVFRRFPEKFSLGIFFSLQYPILFAYRIIMILNCFRSGVCVTYIFWFSITTHLLYFMLSICIGC